MSVTHNIERLNRNFRIIFVITLFLGILAVVRIIYIQFITPDRVTADDIYNEEILEPSRGSILSCDGKPLAVSIAEYELRWDSVTPKDSVFNAGIDSLSLCLSRFFKDKAPVIYKKELKNAREKGNRYKFIGNRNISHDELRKVERFPIFRLGKYKGGLITCTDNERVNPFGKLANRTIGYLNNDGVGTGIEFSYDYKLRGEKGHQVVHRIPGGEWLQVNGESFEPAKDGYDIRTTIDVMIQEAAETELKHQLSLNDVFEGGTAIIMDVETGAVRGIANLFKKRNGTFDESYNYAISHPTEPGSTLKLAALISLLEDGYVTLDTPVNAGNGEWHYGGIRITDTHGYGELTALTAFEKSSNISFAKMVTAAYEENPSAYVARLHNMKLVEKLNLDIDGEGFASIITPDDKEWSKSSLASLAYGYALTLTPLHTLTFYNAVANEGKMMRPYFIQDFEKDGIIYEKFEPVVVSGAICSKNTIKEVKKALRGVLTDGTAKICNDERYQIAGKTGTARIASNGKYEDNEGFRKHQASFVGYFPANNPKYSCIVVLYSGKTKGNFYGGTWAAPVFKRISDKIYTFHPEWNLPIDGKGKIPPDNPQIASGYARYEKISTEYLSLKENFSTEKRGWVKTKEKDGIIETENIKIEKNIVPDVSGMGLKDALYLLENEGYKVSFKGKGRVCEQRPEAGTPINKKDLVEIVLK